MKNLLATPVLVMSLCGCASLIAGSKDRIVVETSPPDAVCVVSRNGEIVSVVRPTPGAVFLGKSKDDLVISCEKDGYEQAVGSLSSEFEPLLIGNIVLVGLIGVAVDFSTGAYTDYPPTIVVPLSPVGTPQTSSLQKTIVSFDEQRLRVEQEYLAEIERINIECGADEGLCNRMAAVAENLRNQQLRILDERMRAEKSAF